MAIPHKAILEPKQFAVPKVYSWDVQVPQKANREQRELEDESVTN